MVLETMDYFMLNIYKDGPHVPMYQSMKENVKYDDEVEKLADDKAKKPVHEFNEEDKRLVSLDVKTRASIGNALPHDIYHLV